MATFRSQAQVTRRRLLTASAATTTLAALLAACAPAQPAAPTSAPAAKPADKPGQTAAPVAAKPQKASGEVSFWYPSEPQAKFLLDEQAKAQPDLKVKFEVGEFDSNTKTMAVLAAGTPPDVSYLGRWQGPDLAVRNAIHAMDDRVKDARSWKWDDVWPQMQKESINWGKKWVVPLVTATRVLFFNKAVVTDAGLDPNKPPTTWSELVEQATKAVKKDSSGKLDRIGFTPTFGNPPSFLMFYSMLWMLGSDLVDETKTKVTLQDKGAEAMTLIKDMVDKQGGYEQASAFTKALTLGEGIDAFSGGKVAFAMNGNWVLPNYDKYSPNLQIGMVPGPTFPPNTEPFNYGGGGGLYYFKKGKNFDGAWELTEFIMTKDFQANWFHQIGAMPVLKSVAEEWTKMDARRPPFIATAPNVRWIPVVVGTLDMLSHITKMWDDIMFGKSEIDQALKTAATQVQIILDKHNSYPAPAG